MQITIDVPDDLAVQLALMDNDPARRTLETIAVEAYRTHKYIERTSKTAARLTDSIVSL